MSTSGAVQETRALAIEGNLTAATAPAVRAQLREVLESGARQVAIDLSRTEIVDSSGIGLLIATHNSLSRNGGQLEVTGLSKELADLFRSMRLDRHFTLRTR
jgi:anti-anti-sigma factor